MHSLRQIYEASLTLRRNHWPKIVSCKIHQLDGNTILEFVYKSKLKNFSNFTNWLEFYVLPGMRITRIYMESRGNPMKINREGVHHAATFHSLKPASFQKKSFRVALMMRLFGPVDKEISGQTATLLPVNFFGAAKVTRIECFGGSIIKFRNCEKKSPSQNQEMFVWKESSPFS